MVRAFVLALVLALSSAFVPQQHLAPRMHRSQLALVPGAEEMLLADLPADPTVLAAGVAAVGAVAVAAGSKDAKGSDGLTKETRKLFGEEARLNSRQEQSYILGADGPKNAFEKSNNQGKRRR